MFLLLPFVIFGVIYLYHQNRIKNIYATDPLVVTYAGGPPTLPMFVVTGMLPGDETEKTFNVENDSPNLVSEVSMEGAKTDEEKSFAEILDVEITELPSTVIFTGKLQNFFDNPPISLGSFPAFSNSDFRVKVKFPFEAGDEYQEAMVKFNLKWVATGEGTGTPTPPNGPTSTPTVGPTPTPNGEVLPIECNHLEGKLYSIIEGTEGDDKLHGDVNSNLILAKGGDDEVDASSGDDCVVLGEGNDEVDSESGNDVIIAGGGNDDVDSGSGNDIVYGGEGNDDIELGSGNDKAYGEGGNDDIDGGADNDEIYGGLGEDILRGGAGMDKLYGDEGNDDLHGISGNDFLDGGADTDDLHGNWGTDTCLNGESNSSCEI